MMVTGALNVSTSAVPSSDDWDVQTPRKLKKSRPATSTQGKSTVRRDAAYHPPGLVDYDMGDAPMARTAPQNAYPTISV